MSEPVSGGGAISDWEVDALSGRAEAAAASSKRRTWIMSDTELLPLISRLRASEARAEAAEAERDEWQRIAKGLAEESVPMLTDHLVAAESRLAAAYAALEAILEEAEYGSWTYALAFNALPDAQPQPTPSPGES